MKKYRALWLAAALWTLIPTVATRAQNIVLEAEMPALQRGSRGDDLKAVASGGKVLGKEFGGKAGDFAEYVFEAPATLSPARLAVRYARQLPGTGRLMVTLDGVFAGNLLYGPSGGWGDETAQYRELSLIVPRLSAGRHRLRLSVAAPRVPSLSQENRLKPVPVLERAGNRADKNSVGHGRNVALYTGTPSRFFFATHELGDIFSAVDGGTLSWHPDHVVTSPDAASGNINIDRIEITPAPGVAAGVAAAGGTSNDDLSELRQVCVTQDDVVVSRIQWTNNGRRPVTRRLEISGDCRKSFDWRGKPGGEKITRREGEGVLMLDKNVFPNVLPEGLAMAAGANIRPVAVESGTPGTYRLTYEIILAPGEHKTATFACAIARDAATARRNLAKCLKQPDSLQLNRRAWQRFYEREVPRFECSDAGLNELYAFRWFLLKFSTAGGDLGLFKYPVVMEGRQAFQTYCCYSAPFMAFDMNWHLDPGAGFGHLANMVHVAYPDGRFPWYTSPRTNDVPLDHPSKTGQSLLPWAAWRFYQTHGRKDLLREIYPGLKKNLQWWIKDRDADGNGLFSIDHQLETGMDDLFRRWKTAKPARYEAVDATAYAVVNLQAVANMARELGQKEDAAYFNAYAARAATALRHISWDAELERFRDRNPETGELADYNSICIFYPLFAGVAQTSQLGMARRYLLNPAEYWTAHPIPALSQSDPDFDPVRGYWRGPSWPAATSHIVEGFASTAKRLDRSLLPQAATLLQRAAALHLQPRADFYERYNPFSGQPLSNFRDYMHSWWIDIIIRHVAGLTPRDDGSLVIDPLPMNLKHFALQNAPHRGHRVDVLWKQAGRGKGLTVRLDGEVMRRDKDFQPGAGTLVLPARLFR